MSIALVPDILLDIFLATSGHVEPLEWAEAPMEALVFNKSRHFDRSVRLREITHVCRYWRDVAIHSPKLWRNHIDCTNMAPKWFQLVLKRAQEAHLFVTIPRLYAPRSFKDHTLTNFEYLIASGKQFAGLHADVIFHTTEVKNAVLAQMAEPMPALSQCTWFYYPPDPITLNLFGGEAPSLRKIYLRGFLPTIQSGICQRLTHVILLDCARPQDGWIEFLRQTQDLEELTIGLEPDNALEPSTPKLDFPRLTALTIEGDYSTAGKLLASMQAAVLKHMNVSVNNVPLGDPSGLLNPLATFFPSHSWQTRDTVELHLRADLISVKVVAICGFTVALRAMTYGICKEPQFLAALSTSLKTRFTSCDDLVVMDRFMGDLGRLHNDPLITLILPFENVTTITLHKTVYARILQYHSYNTHHFERNVTLLPSLQTMILHGSIITHFYDVCVFLARKIAEGRPLLKVCFTAEVGEELQEKAEEKRVKLSKDFDIRVEFLECVEGQVE